MKKNTYGNPTCLLFGEQTLLIRCGKVLQENGFDVVGVVADNPRIQHWSQENDIDCLTWKQFSSDNPSPSDSKVDYIFSITNLRRLPSAVLRAADIMAVNYHDGPLPDMPGINVPAWAILHGHDQHGITWHVMTDELDAGDILVERRIPITDKDTTLTLNAKCHEAGLDAFHELVVRLGEGEIAGEPQAKIEDASVCLAKDRPENLCIIPPEQPAESIVNLVRALSTGTYDNQLGLAKIMIPGGIVYVGTAKSRPLDEAASEIPVGQVLVNDQQSRTITVRCADAEITFGSLLDGSGRQLSTDDVSEIGHIGDMGAAYDNTDVPGWLKQASARQGALEEYWAPRLQAAVRADLPYFVSAAAGVERAEQPDNEQLDLPAGFEADRTLAALVVYLGRLNDETAFVVDLLLDGVAGSGEESGLGRHFYLGTSLLAVDMNRDQGFSEISRSVSEELTILRQHAWIPRDLCLRYTSIPTALLEESPVVLINLSGATVEPESNQLVMQIDASGLSLTSNSALVKPLASIAQEIGDFIERLVADPDCSICDHGLVSDQECLQLASLNRTQTETPTYCVDELIWQQARDNPEQAVVAFRDQTITYRELVGQADKIAAALAKKSIDNEARVGLLLTRSIEMIAAMLGILKAGAAFIPMDPAYPRSRLDFMIKDSGMSCVLSQQGAIDRISGDVDILDIDGVLADADFDDAGTDHRASLKRLAYIIYTSGTTGKPKGVMVEHGNLSNFILAMDERIPLGDDPVWLAVTSISFDISILELLWTLARGVKVVVDYGINTDDVLAHLPDVERVKRHANPEPSPDFGLAALIRRHAVTHLQCTPSLARMMLIDKGVQQAMANIRCMLVGGEVLPEDLAGQLRETIAGKLLNMYGPTETTIWSTTCDLTDADTGISIGRPVANTTIHLLGSCDKPVPFGAVGELVIGGRGVVRGYHDRPELTAERFVIDPYDNGSGRMYRTGDLARYSASGDIEFLGRNDFQAKIRGYRIELEEIESILLQHDDVNECVVVARETGHGGAARLVAYVTLTSSAGAEMFDESELRRHVSRHVADFMVPEAVVLLDEMPLSPNGKLDRKALPNLQGQAEPAESDAASEMESVIIDIWRDLLGRADIRRNDNFFALGGHSLLVVQVISQISKRYKLDLRLSDFFQNPTVCKLAARLEKDAVQPRVPIPGIPVLDRVVHSASPSEFELG